MRLRASVAEPPRGRSVPAAPVALLLCASSVPDKGLGAASDRVPASCLGNSPVSHLCSRQSAQRTLSTSPWPYTMVVGSRV